MTVAGRRQVFQSLLVGAFLAFGKAFAQERARATSATQFRLVHDDTVMLDALVAGSKVAVLLDSGAGASILDSGIASKLAVETVGERGLLGNTGSTRLPRIAQLPIEVAQSAFELKDVGIADLAEISSSMGVPVDLILGRDLFRGRAIDIDFEARVLSIRPSGFRLPGSRSLPITFGTRGEACIPITVGEHAAVEAVIDLGSAGALMIAREYADQAELLAGRRTSNAAMIGIEGISTTTSVEVETIRIGDTTFRNVPSEVVDKWTLETPASVGLLVLSRFHLVLDFDRGVAQVASRRGATAPPFREDHSGLGIAFRGDHLEVVFVAAGSPAALGNWRVGEMIGMIDHHSITAEYAVNDVWRWRYRPPGTRVDLLLSNGERRTLTLADYY